MIEKEIATINSKKTIAFKNKWHITNDIISITQMNACKTWSGEKNGVGWEGNP